MIPVLYWMLECTACGSRLVVHDSYLKFVGSGPNPPPGAGYGGPPLPERYTCTKGCSRPMKAIGSISSPDDKTMWLHEPHVPIGLTMKQADEWRRLIQAGGRAGDRPVVRCFYGPPAHPRLDRDNVCLASPPAPVNGVVISGSTSRALRIIRIYSLWFLMSVMCLVVIWVSGPIADHTIRKSMIAGVCGLVLFCALFIVVAQLRWLWLRRRLIIGTDRLQVVENSRGADTIVLQIPYQNIAEFAYKPATESAVDRICIDLHRLDDPETYTKRFWWDFESNKDICKSHYVIEGDIFTGYQASLPSIADAIRRAMEDWRGEGGSLQNNSARGAAADRGRDPGSKPGPRTFGRRTAPAAGCDDFDWMFPPRTLVDPAAWDRYWHDQLLHGMARFVHLFCDDGELVDAMRANGLKTVLCVGNGISQEPRALAWAGFQVTALDLSPLATRAASEVVLPDEFLAGLVGGRSGEPNGHLEFVVGDLCDVACCPGPYDVVIDRKTLQLYPDKERPIAMRAVANRLASPGIFFCHCHDGTWRPPAPRRHPLESWFVTEGWTFWRGNSPLTGRVAWPFFSTG